MLFVAHESESFLSYRIFFEMLITKRIFQPTISSTNLFVSLCIEKRGFAFVYNFLSLGSTVIIFSRFAPFHPIFSACE